MNIKRKVKDFIAENTSFIFTIPSVLWQILFLYTPLLLIIYASIHTLNMPFFEITFSYYRALLNTEYFHIIFRSLFLAFNVTLFCLLLAYPVAYFLALKVHSRLKNVLLFLLTLPFWTNFLIQIYSWVFVLDYTGLLNTFLLKIGVIQEPLHMINNVCAIFLVMVYYYLPFMIMPLYSILEKIQLPILEASLDLGANHWQTFRRITIPLSMSGIKTGVFLVFVPAFGEFAIPAIIGGGKQLFVGSLISHYFLVARDNQLGAAFTIMSGLVLLFFVLIFNWLCKVPLQINQKEV